MHRQSVFNDARDSLEIAKDGAMHDLGTIIKYPRKAVAEMAMLKQYGKNDMLDSTAEARADEEATRAGFASDQAPQPTALSTRSKAGEAVHFMEPRQCSTTWHVTSLSSWQTLFGATALLQTRFGSA